MAKDSLLASSSVELRLVPGPRVASSCVRSFRSSRLRLLKRDITMGRSGTRLSHGTAGEAPKKWLFVRFTWISCVTKERVIFFIAPPTVVIFSSSPGLGANLGSEEYDEIS